MFVASPEPPNDDISLTDFGNFVGVSSVTATDVGSAGISDSNTVTSTAATTVNKLASKDDIMALYGNTPVNHSNMYNMALTGMFHFVYRYKIRSIHSSVVG